MSCRQVGQPRTAAQLPVGNGRKRVEGAEVDIFVSLKKISTTAPFHYVAICRGRPTVNPLNAVTSSLQVAPCW